MIAGRILLIGVPDEWLVAATLFAKRFMKDVNPGEHRGSRRCVAYRHNDAAFLVWISLAGKQICVRYSA